MGSHLLQQWKGSQTSSTAPSTSTARISRQYLEMPEKKKRALGYIRESKLMPLDAPTMESAAKYVREYCQRMGYDYDPVTDERRESQSAYEGPYFERPVLMQALADSVHYDVFVCT